MTNALASAKRHPLFGSPRLRQAALVLTAIVLGVAAWRAIDGRLIDAAILAVFVLAALGLALWDARLPPLFTFLFTVAATINAAGYVFDLWRSPVWFDEFVHVVTPFVVIAAASWLLIARDDVRPLSNAVGYFARVLILGLLIGLAWEGFEYVIGIVNSRLDSVVDLAMDCIGSLLAAAFCLYAARLSGAPALSEG